MQVQTLFANSHIRTSKRVLSQMMKCRVLNRLYTLDKKTNNFFRVKILYECKYSVSGHGNKNFN